MDDKTEKRLADYATRPRSVSQAKQYDQCPYGYYLARIKREPELQAAWLGHGVAVHAAAEAWEKSGRSLGLEGAQEVFKGEYAKMANRGLEAEPNETGWQASGPYTGFVDLERRWGLGLDQVRKYLDWYEANPDQVIWKDAEGKAAIELKFDLDLDGVQVIGFIDQVIETKKNGPRARDIKTGVIPKADDTFQLDTYALAMKDQYGISCETGDFWSGKTGRPSRARKLSASRDQIVEVFKTMDEGVKAQDFRPKPGEACGRCPVQRSCTYGV
ncbi:PD-(D/E)XK nuclease family protein [Streptomyces sp. NPDC004732]|uniref:RecB family exonuclease n=1 Tax=Streptomyces sp. NPDC004732 TaxID=3154290 RepID=UPI0033B7231D